MLGVSITHESFLSVKTLLIQNFLSTSDFIVCTHSENEVDVNTIYETRFGETRNYRKVKSGRERNTAQKLEVCSGCIAILIISVPCCLRKILWDYTGGSTVPPCKRCYIAPLQAACLQPNSLFL